MILVKSSVGHELHHTQNGMIWLGDGHWKKVGVD